MMTNDASVAKAEEDLKALLADIDEREKAIADWEKRGGLHPLENNFRYVFDFDFPGSAITTLDFPLQRQTVQVKKNTAFKAKSIGQAFMVVGTRTLEDDSEEAATLTLSQVKRLISFDYKFKIRDTGSDRDWQDNWLQAGALFSGDVNEFQFRNGHMLVSPGAEITIEVSAKKLSGDTGLDSISAYNLQLSLAGFEVPYDEGDH